MGFNKLRWKVGQPVSRNTLCRKSNLGASGRFHTKGAEHTTFGVDDTSGRVDSFITPSDSPPGPDSDPRDHCRAVVDWSPGAWEGRRACFNVQSIDFLKAIHNFSLCKQHDNSCFRSVFASSASLVSSGSRSGTVRQLPRQATADHQALQQPRPGASRR